MNQTARRGRCVPVLLVLTASLAVAIPAAGQSGEEARAPVPSLACGENTGTLAPSKTVQLGEDTRRIEVHVAAAHDGDTPLPVIIWLHGQGMSESDLADLTDLPAFAQANDVVVVAPQGHQPDAGWMWEPGVAGVEPGLGNRDVAIVDALIDQLGNELCLDLARVYATGYSIGGHGATALACRLSDRIAAVVAASGFTDLGDACQASRVVPIMAMAGTADEYILFDGGLGDFLSDRLPWGATKGQEPFFQRPDWSLAPVDRMAGIALRNGCQPDPASDELADGVVRLAWACADGSEHELITVDGGGHDWSIERSGVDANEVYWEFLSRFSLPG